MIVRLQHAAILSAVNQRRLARFYQLVFGMQEIWNRSGRSPYPYYLGDGRLQLNCNLIREGSKRFKKVGGEKIFPSPGINHIGFQVERVQEIVDRLKKADPNQSVTEAFGDGRYETHRLIDPDGNDIELSEGGWDAGRSQRGYPMVQHIGIRTKNPHQLAEFYEAVFGLKRINPGGWNTVSLSDGFVGLTLTNVSLVEKTGFQVIGFNVPSIEEIQKKLAQAWLQYSFMEEEQQKIIRKDDCVYPFKPWILYDPEGNCINLCEEGWEA